MDRNWKKLLKIITWKKLLVSSCLLRALPPVLNIGLSPHHSYPALVCRCRGPVDLEWRAKPNDGSNKGIMVVVAIGHHYLINKTPCIRGCQKMTTGWHRISEATRTKTSSKQQMWQVNPKPEEWTLSSIFSQSVLGGGTTKLYSRTIVQFHYMEEVWFWIY